MISLDGKVALITGASRGIGAACARLFADAGADVVLNYFQSAGKAEEVYRRLSGKGTHRLVPADVSSEKGVDFLVSQIMGTYRRLDILVANAGIWEGKPIQELEEMDWDRILRINLKSVFLCCRAAAKIMGAQRSGNIITVSSTAGQRGEAFFSGYAASKGAIISFTKSLASELGPQGVRVNCVAPGWVDTDMAAPALRADPEARRTIERAIPVGRVATAEDIAGPILFLASSLSRHIQGEVLNINGGSVLCG